MKTLATIKEFFVAEGLSPKLMWTERRWRDAQKAGLSTLVPSTGSLLHPRRTGNPPRYDELHADQGLFGLRFDTLDYAIMPNREDACSLRLSHADSDRDKSIEDVSKVFLVHHTM
ncbi:hypothetical protein KM043_011691 [Ampulex compressa]|nr:hypothetical protein KM043_011691 [Ampulex compressa]